MDKIGFIGLGIMVKAGYKLVVHDINQISVDEIVSLGAENSSSPQEVANKCKFIITMLPNSPQVKEVVLGKGGLIEGFKRGSVFIDMSSISPIVSRELYTELDKIGVDMLDAPVSGGEPKAIEGTLSVMVGGKKEIYDRSYPLLKAMAASVVHTGGIGAGNVTKLANQIIVALNIAAMSEALVLATKAGVEPELVYQAIRGGLAGSTVLDAKAPLVMDRKFNPGFRINLHIKDLSNALDTSHEIGVPLPLTSAVMEIMQALKVDGMGENDHGSLIRYYEKLAKIEVKR
jgi:2-hydroxy-3-oxopropionate reductase